MELITLIVGLVVGALLGAVAAHFVARPKLALTGSGAGGGPGPGYWVNSARITNQPGLIGLRLGESVVAGRTVHRYIKKGLVIERTAARECSARLIDPETDAVLAPLWWRQLQDGVARATPTLDIASGAHAELLLFARRNDETLRYFPYRPEADGITPAAPPDGAKLTESRRFRVEVVYAYNTRRLRFDVRMSKRLDGSFEYAIGGGGGSF